MLTQASMGVLATALGILTISGYVRLWHVYVFAFLFGAAAALDAPVRQTFVGELVGDEYLSNAVALNSTSFVACQMIGPAVAGLVIAKFGTGWAFLANGLSFGAILLSMVLLRVQELRTNARASRGPGGFIEGLRYVWARPDLRSILIMLVLVGIFGMNFPIFISTMAVNVYHVDARGFGLLSSMMAIGTVSGALLAAERDKPMFGTLCLGSGVFGIGCTLAAFSPGYWWFAAALAVIGAAAITFMTATNSMIQLSTEPTMRGRVVATGMGVMLGGTALGAPIAGWVANHFGPRWSLGIAAVSAFLAALVAALMMAKPVAAPLDT
jgi:MFS family permease